jgi:DNA-binding transcriptional ArsR family regulator
MVASVTPGLVMAADTQAAAAGLLSARAKPSRLGIFRLLREGPMAVGAVADALGLDVVNVSHHLNTLRRARVRKRAANPVLEVHQPG